MKTPEKNAREFLANSINSYTRLAEHLNITNPRSDGTVWTKDSAYHLCRKNSIVSKRRCRSQPAASITQRKRTQQAILNALESALGGSKAALAALAPFETKDIARLSKHSAATVLSNWYKIERELYIMAGLPPKPITLSSIS